MPSKMSRDNYQSRTQRRRNTKMVAGRPIFKFVGRNKFARRRAVNVGQSGERS